MPNDLPSTARLEAFSDGVIAVIITIMVLELKVPLAAGSTGLHAVYPTLMVYGLSFAFTGIYWINHHHLLERIHKADHSVLYANLVFLFSLSLLPFFTSWVLVKEIDAFSVALYAVSLIVTGAGFFLLRLAVDRRCSAEGGFEEESTAEQRKHMLSLVIYLMAIPLAFFHTRVALADLTLVTLLWIVPTASTNHVRLRSAQHAGDGLHPSSDHDAGNR